jgi:hypothetical protein
MYMESQVAGVLAETYNTAPPAVALVKYALVGDY